MALTPPSFLDKLPLNLLVKLHVAFKPGETSHSMPNQAYVWVFHNAVEPAVKKPPLSDGEYVAFQAHPHTVSARVTLKYDVSDIETKCVSEGLAVSETRKAKRLEPAKGVKSARKGCEGQPPVKATTRLERGDK